MIIGLSGKKHCGKDTAANIICQLVPSCIKYAFAAELKNEVARATGFSVRYIDEHKESFRLILQGWGTDFRRKIFGEYYWIKKMEEAIVTLSSRYQNIIIPDVRFKNELDWIKGKGGMVFRIERFVDFSDTHVSETELDGAQFDGVLLNHGTEQNLEDKLVKLDIVKELITTNTKIVTTML